MDGYRWLEEVYARLRPQWRNLSAIRRYCQVFRYLETRDLPVCFCIHEDLWSLLRPIQFVLEASCYLEGEFSGK
jgi:hypothetical protein